VEFCTSDIEGVLIVVPSSLALPLARRKSALTLFQPAASHFRNSLSTRNARHQMTYDVFTLKFSPTLYHLGTVLKKAEERRWRRQEDLPESPQNKSLPNLVPIQPAGARPPLLWIHGDWSNAFLPAVLGRDQPFYAFKHQSRDGRPALYTEVETIAEFYLTQVRSVQTEGPYFLGGYSFGGTLAFEMARQLMREGHEVAFLFIIDSLSPGSCNESVPRRVSGPSSVRSSVVERGREIQHRLRGLLGLGPRQQVDYILRRVKDRLQQWKRAVTRSFKELTCRVHVFLGRPLPFFVRNHYILGIYHRAVAQYNPSAYVGRAIYIKSEMRPSYHGRQWSALCQGGLEIHEVAGAHHLDIAKEAKASLWAEKLKSDLRKAQATEELAERLVVKQDAR
jgi:thioesterase domain-containing protein